MKKKEMKLRIEELESKDKREDFNLETRKYAGREFDRLIVILSGGGLTLSVGMLEKIKDLITPENKYFLLLSWISLIGSLLLILISQLTSLKSIDYEILEKNRISDNLDFVTDWLNYISLFFLGLGIVMFIYFIYNVL